MTSTVRQCLATGRPTISFELMPPKTAEDERRIWSTVRALEPLDPSFVSVTYGAGGSTRDTTIAVVEQIAHETPLLPVAHLLRCGPSGSTTPPSWPSACSTRALRVCTSSS